MTATRGPRDAGDGGVLLTDGGRSVFWTATSAHAEGLHADDVRTIPTPVAAASMMEVPKWKVAPKRRGRFLLEIKDLGFMMVDLGLDLMVNKFESSYWQTWAWDEAQV